MSKSQPNMDPNQAHFDDPIDVDGTNAQDLLTQTNTSIKNLNHSLLKLVAVQQESIAVSKNTLSQFTVMDRVPVYLELESKNMPAPCQIRLFPVISARQLAPSGPGSAQNLAQTITSNMVVYLSTETKNPSERNH